MLLATLRNFAVRLVVATVLSFCQNVGSVRAADTLHPDMTGTIKVE